MPDAKTMQSGCRKAAADQEVHYSTSVLPKTDIKKGKAKKEGNFDISTVKSSLIVTIMANLANLVTSRTEFNVGNEFITLRVTDPHFQGHPLTQLTL